MEDPPRTIYSDPRVPGDDEAVGESVTESPILASAQTGSTRGGSRKQLLR
jgi:hypothetical protein